MNRGVSLGDGVRIELSDGTTVVADADEPDGDVTLLSHAHGDHLFGTDPGPVVCSPATADIARARRDAPVERTTDDRIELHPAGHVVGSRAAVIRDPDGTRYCYTGDCATSDRLHLDGFEPPDADVLVIEATYGTPAYELPPQDAVAAGIVDWLADTDRPVLAFGYSLGRAQKLQLLAARAGRTAYVTDAVARVNRAVEPHVDVAFDAEPYGEDVTLGSDDVLVVPPNCRELPFVERLVDERDAVPAGFSGWAVEEAFRHRGGYERTFPLSDHCDFAELREVVRTVDPDRVYTHHGFAEALADTLVADGYDATALKRDQATLADF